MRTGVRWWIKFCVAMELKSYVLYTEEEMPLSWERQRQVELLLVCFMQWLSRIEPAIRGKTIGGYCDHVCMWMQHVVCGVPFSEVVLSRGKLRAMRKSFVRLRPSKYRAKRAFTVPEFRQLQRAVWRIVRSASKTTGEKFRAHRVEMMVAAALEALLRTSEMADSKVASASNLEPFALQDLHFHYLKNGVECECEWNEDGTVDTTRAMYLRVPMTSTKSDQFGQDGEVLYFPRGANPGDVGTFELTSQFVNRYPVPRARHPAVPWFRNLEHGNYKQVTHYDFMVDVAKVLRAAGVSSKGLGKHSFRVGGMNALQDAGASVPEIMALGRWASDAWRVYARRERKGLLRWTARVLQSAPPA